MRPSYTQDDRWYVWAGLCAKGDEFGIGEAVTEKYTINIMAGGS